MIFDNFPTIIDDSDKAYIVELLEFLPEPTGLSPFDVMPPHASPLHFYDAIGQDYDSICQDAATEMASLTTGPEPRDTLAQRWKLFLQLAERSPPFFQPVVDGIEKIVAGLGSTVAYEVMTAEERLEIATRLGKHILKIRSLMSGDTEEENQKAAIEAALTRIENSGNTLCHNIYSNIYVSRPERFDALILAVELSPMGEYQNTFIHCLTSMVSEYKGAPWLKEHVEAIGSDYDIKYTRLFEFRVDTLKALRSPGEVFLDGLRILVDAPRSYAYKTPELPRPSYQSRAEQITPA